MRREQSGLRNAAPANTRVGWRCSPGASRNGSTDRENRRRKDGRGPGRSTAPRRARRAADRKRPRGRFPVRDWPSDRYDVLPGPTLSLRRNAKSRRRREAGFARCPRWRLLPESVGRFVVAALPTTDEPSPSRSVQVAAPGGRESRARGDERQARRTNACLAAAHPEGSRRATPAARGSDHARRRPLPTHVPRRTSEMPAIAGHQHRCWAESETKRAACADERAAMPRGRPRKSVRHRLSSAGKRRL